MGTGVAILYSFHLNVTLLAKLPIGDRPMTSLSICARYSKVVCAHGLNDQRVLLNQDAFGNIAAQELAPDERHVIFGVCSSKVVCCPILLPQVPVDRHLGQ
ncbi:hypothetical protein CCR75_004986 [Bremia lactucae]|uniref:Uncharacterized protein n=1 Tax=Bremia lactucae TaxID=4779 RepID=A0A976FQG8_BRELC|nr:hypothetical protein CCR75_004986 [Bremia lactucae]